MLILVIGGRIRAYNQGVNVSLTPELEAYVQACAASGQYASSSEVVREALRLHQEYHARRTWLKEAIEQGLESARTGPMVSWDEVSRDLDALIDAAEEKATRPA